MTYAQLCKFCACFLHSFCFISHVSAHMRPLYLLCASFRSLLSFVNPDGEPSSSSSSILDFTAPLSTLGSSASPSLLDFTSASSSSSFPPSQPCQIESVRFGRHPHSEEEKTHVRQLAADGLTASGISEHFSQSHHHLLPRTTAASIVSHSSAAPSKRGRPPSVSLEEEENVHDIIRERPQTQDEISRLFASSSSSMGSRKLVHRFVKDHNLVKEKQKQKSTNAEEEIKKLDVFFDRIFRIRKTIPLCGIANIDETYFQPKEIPPSKVYRDIHTAPRSSPIRLLPFSSCSLVLGTTSQGYILTPLLIFHGEKQHPRYALRPPTHPLTKKVFPMVVAFTPSAFNRTSLYEVYLHRVIIPQIKSIEELYKKKMLVLHDDSPIHTHPDIRHLLESEGVQSDVIEAKLTGLSQAEDQTIHSVIKSYVYDKYGSLCRKWPLGEPPPDVGAQRNFLLQWFAQAIFLKLSPQLIRHSHMVTGTIATPDTIDQVHLFTHGQRYVLDPNLVPNDGLRYVCLSEKKGDGMG